MTIQEQHDMQQYVDTLKAELRQARLENAIHSTAGVNQPLEGLAEYLKTKFPSDYALLVILRAKADMSHRHALLADDPSPAILENNLRPVVYYTGQMMTKTEELCRKHFQPRSTHFLFPADMDMGLLICPDSHYVSETNISSGNYLKEVYQQLNALLGDMDREFMLENTASISRIWKDRLDLQKMYQETKDAYDYGWNRSGKLFAYDEFCTAPMSSNDRMLLCSLEEEFSNDTVHLLFDEASVVLGNILSIMLRNTLPFADIRTSVTARLRNILTVLDYNAGISQETLRSLTLLQQKVAVSVSIPELQDRIFDFFAALNNISPSSRAKKSTQILEFIEANSKNPNLNAEMLCDRFHISRTYVSKLIKKETGFGLVDTLHRVRVEHAKNLLKTTELTTEQIAVQVGFTNRFGLIRAFRNQENTTPAEYRAKFALNPEPSDNAESC